MLLAVPFITLPLLGCDLESTLPHAIVLGALPPLVLAADVDEAGDPTLASTKPSLPATGAAAALEEEAAAAAGGPGRGSGEPHALPPAATAAARPPRRPFVGADDEEEEEAAGSVPITSWIESLVQYGFVFLLLRLVCLLSLEWEGRPEK